MTELERAQIRMTCMIEASKLKQNPTTKVKYEHKDVVEIAEELAKFVLNK